MTRSPLQNGWSIVALAVLNACAPSPASPDSSAGPDGSTQTNGGVDGGDGGFAFGLAPASDGGHDAGDSSSPSDAALGSEMEAGTASDASGGGADAASEASAPFVLVPFESGSGIFAIAIDDINLYWTGENPPGTSTTVVMSVPKAGGSPVIVYNGGGGQAGALALDAENAYFEQYTCCPIANSVYQVAKDGSTDAGSALLLDQTGSASGIPDIAVDSVNVYFASSNAIYSVPIGGGPQSTVVDPTGTSPVDPIVGLAIGFPGISGLTTDGTNVYYAAGQTYGGAISSSSPLAYSGWLLSVPVAGGTPTILAPDEQDAGGSGDTYVHFGGTHPSVNDGFVYWGNGTSRFLYKEPIQGESPITLASSNVGGSDVATDGTNVYYLGNTGLMKLSVDGGSPVELVHDQGAYNFGGTGGFPLAVDDTSVYVIAYSGQGIVKIAK